MLAPSPGAPALVFSAGAMTEVIPRALVQEALHALPDDLAIAKELRRWLELSPGTSLDSAKLAQAAADLVAYTHANPGELGTLALLSSRAGGRVTGTSSAPDDDLTSAATVLALALERFVLLSNLGSSISIADTVAGGG